MTERYRLDGELLPTIPVPHDGMITRLEIGGDCITFRFEEDIGRRDAIAYIHPGAKSLIIRYHLTEDGFRLYRWHRRIPLLFPNLMIFYLQARGKLVTPSERKNPPSEELEELEDHKGSFEV